MDKVREIEELMARIRELEKEKSANQSAAEHRTMTPPEPIPAAKDDLKDIFLDPFATNISAHTIIPTELFATPRESDDLIDLSTPTSGGSRGIEPGPRRAAGIPRVPHDHRGAQGGHQVTSGPDS